MANEEYRNYEELVEKKYRGKKTINRWKVDALKKAREALRKLNREIETCYTHKPGENNEGIGEERLKSIQKCYVECLNAVGNARDKNSQTDILNTIYKVLSDDIATVNGLRAEDSFPEYFRREVVEFEAMPVQPVGGYFSQRIPMQYEDEKGNKVRGFFTKESKIEVRELKDVLPEIARKEDEKYAYGPLFSNLIQIKEFTNVMDTDGGSFTDFFDTIRKQIDARRKNIQPSDKEKWKTAEIDVWKDFFHEKNVSTDHIQWGKDGENLTEYIEKFAEEYLTSKKAEKFKENQKEKAGLYHSFIRVEAGENITDRNCAMTEIARLLGRDDLLARSMPMEICYQGEKQKGVFMETAKGENYQRVKEQPLTKHLDRINPSALKDIADLQMIDYICGNVDRHVGNIIYQFDKDGNLEHIQGIDHDMSMGEISQDGGVKCLPKVQNMRVISQTMAERIRSLQQEDIQTMLAALDLPQKQKNAAWERVEHMQGELENAVEMSEEGMLKKHTKYKGLYIVPDDKWKSIDAGQLSAKFNWKQYTDGKIGKNEFGQVEKYNIFSRLYNTGRLIDWNEKHKKQNLESNLESNALPKEVEQRYNEGRLVSLAFRPEVLRKDAGIMADLMNHLNETIKKEGLESRSKEFKDMYASVKAVNQWYIDNRDKEVTADGKEVFKKLCTETAISCKTYIDGHNPYSKIGKKRQEIATELMEFMGVRSIEINRYDLSQKADDLQRDKAVQKLGQIAQKESLLGEDKSSAMTLMAAVICTDEQRGIPRDTIKSQISFEKNEKQQSLTSKDIREFLEKEKKMVDDWMTQKKENQKENSLPRKKEKSGIERNL